MMIHRRINAQSIIRAPFLYAAFCICIFSESYAQETWVLRNPPPPRQDFTLYAITWGNGTYIAVGSDGTIVTSDDAITWTKQVSGTQQKLSSIVWGDSQFIAAGDSGTFLSSSDGVSWKKQNSHSNANITSIAWGKDRFVAVGILDSVFISYNGTTWEKYPGFSQSVTTIIWAKDHFYSMSTVVIKSSTDGINWTDSYSFPQLLGSFISGRLFWTGKNIFAELNRNDMGPTHDVITSSDGLTWSVVYPILQKEYASIVWGGDRYVAIATDGTINTSSDFNSWEAVFSGTNMLVSSLVWQNNQYIAVGEHGIIRTSLDGKNWTTRMSVSGYGLNHDLISVTSGNNSFAAAGTQTILSSPDGIAWNFNLSLSGFDNIYSIAWGGNIFVTRGYHEIMGSHGFVLGSTVLTSSDCITWVHQDSSILTANILGIAWGAKTFVGVGGGWGYGGVIITSSDGRIWTSCTSGTNAYLCDVTCSNDNFVAIGDSGTILISGDGVNWSKQSSGKIESLQAVCWGNGTYVILCNDSSRSVLTSQNGISWTRGLSGAKYRLFDVAWGGNAFVAVGDSGTILSSSDGSIWQPKVSGTIKPLRSVTWGKNLFVAVGDSGTILTSEAIAPVVRFKQERSQQNDVVFSGNIVRYSLASPARTDLSLYDLSGRFVCHLANGPQHSGSHAIPLSHGISRGSYILSFKAGENISISRIAVTH